MAQLNDYGTTIKMTVQDDGSDVDLTSFNTHEIILVDPSDNKKTYSASVSGSNSEILEVDVSQGDLDEVGFYSLQGRVEDTDNQFYTSVTSFRVNKNL